MNHEEWDKLLRLRNRLKHSIYVLGTLFNQLSGDLEDLEVIVKNHKPKKTIEDLVATLEKEAAIKALEELKKYSVEEQV